MLLKEVEVFNFSILTASIHLRTGEVIRDFAINDVYLERASGQTA